MKFAIVVASVGLLALSSVPSVAAEHPVENVIGLLKGLITKVEAEGKAQAVTYEKFQYWCKNSVKTLNKAIEEEKAAIDRLESKIEAKTKEQATLEEQIKALEDELGRNDAAGVAADKKRADEKGLYDTASSDISDTISAVKEALVALAAAETTTESGLLQGARRQVQRALLYIQASVSSAERGALEAFGQAAPRPGLKAMGDRGAHVDKYDFKSENVIELLKELQKKFEDELLAANVAETNGLNAHSLAKDARTNAWTAADTSKSQKNSALSEVISDLTLAKATLADEQSDFNSDTNTLETTEKTCARRASEWADRSDIRTKEVEAMNIAIKILSKATGVRTEAPSNPVPPPSPVAAAAASFLQVVDPKMKAVNLLRAEARVAHSRQLERLAQEMAAHLDGPFDDLNNMVEKMIFRLMAEQKDEDDHKNWCDKEISKTDASVRDKTDKVAELTGKINFADATVQKLSEDIKDANQMVSDITTFMKEAAEIRETGKRENDLAVKDATAAQKAIANAIAVLEDFYKESGMVEKEAWEFVQEPAPVELPSEPKLWESSYTGTTDPKGQPAGIVSVLKGTAAEFASMESDTLAQEAMDQDSFDADMKDNEIEKAGRLEESNVKSQEKKRLLGKIESMTKERKNTDDELKATEQYRSDLKHPCEDGDSTYEDRKSARDEEIGALKEAQRVLTDAFKEGGKGGKGGASFLAMQW